LAAATKGAARQTAHFSVARTLTGEPSVRAPKSPTLAEPESSLGACDEPLQSRELFELVYRRMRTLAPHDADFDDLVQAAATEVWRSLPRFEGRSQLSTWLYGVCYRVLLNHRRFWRRYRLRFSVGVDEALPSEAPDAPELFDQCVRAARLRGLLGSMSDKYRVVVILHDLEELSVPQIAEIVGASELTVRSRLRDGRKQLRRLLELDPVLVLREA
jgi:RNA polymerase sigma-70 factor (ECF subfamily)